MSIEFRTALTRLKAAQHAWVGKNLSSTSAAYKEYKTAYKQFAELKQRTRHARHSTRA